MAKLPVVKWLIPGIGIKRWLLLMLSGIVLIAAGLCVGLMNILTAEALQSTLAQVDWWVILAALFFGVVLIVLGLNRMSHSLLAPYRVHQQGRIVDVVHAYTKRQRGKKVVAIGGGTGLPSVLRAMKIYTSNITAIVTVADDGGSSGRLRRDFGVLPPGDLRNNIAALADDESLMTQLFQYRFSAAGDLEGHSFGNLFITALSGVTGSLETALIETERVLNIQGRVLPATLQDVQLVATVQLPGKDRLIKVQGESKISEVGGKIEHIGLLPENIEAYPESIQAILNANLVVIGPGSLYTSILPNLLVKGIGDALRATSAHKVYVCNVATQPGETSDYSVAEHVLALERYIGRGVIQTVLANNAYPTQNAGSNTFYVQPVPEGHEILQRYMVYYADLVDPERPWRHDPQKLADALLGMIDEERTANHAVVKAAFVEAYIQ